MAAVITNGGIRRGVAAVVVDAFADEDMAVSRNEDAERI